MEINNPLKNIIPQEAINFIPLKEDFITNYPSYYTITPSTNETYSFEDGWEDVTYYTKRTRNKAPHDGKGDELIYILSNPTYPHLLKIGYTRKNIEIRIKDLSKATGVPTPFVLEYTFNCNNGKELEYEIHKYLRDYRPNNYREFFEIDLKTAMEVVKKLGENY